MVIRTLCQHQFSESGMSRRLRASLCSIFRYIHCYVDIRTAVALHSSRYNTSVTTHTSKDSEHPHKWTIWNLPHAGRGTCCKMHFVTAMRTGCNTYLNYLVSNTGIWYFSWFQVYFLGRFAFICNYVKFYFILSVFPQVFKKCQSIFWFRKSLLSHLDFFCVHFHFSSTNKEIFNATCLVDNLLELKCRRKIKKACQDWNVLQAFCKKCLWKYCCCLCFLSEDIAGDSNWKQPQQFA